MVGLVRLLTVAEPSGSDDVEDESTTGVLLGGPKSSRESNESVALEVDEGVDVCVDAGFTLALALTLTLTYLAGSL